jgi:hypothetical protein
MKIAFLVCNEVYSARIVELFAKTQIDYYTSWEQVKGKGHGTQPHLGTRSFPGMNVVFMIAFAEESPLTDLIQEIKLANEHIHRPDDLIRLFQVPLEKIV